MGSLLAVALLVLPGPAASAGPREDPTAGATFTQLAAPFPDRPVTAKLSWSRERGTISGGIAKGSVSRRTGGFVIATAAGALTATPNLGAPVGAASATGARATAGRGVDVNLRPSPLGFTSEVRFADTRRSRSVSWRLSLPHAKGSRALHDGARALLAANAHADDGVAHRRLPRGTRMVASASRPTAFDRRGRQLRSSLRATPGGLTLTVARSRGPATARIAWSATGSLRGGWWSYGARAPSDASVWRISQGRSTAGGGCGYVERGSLPAGVVERSQQAASATRGCRSLVHTSSTVAPAPFSEPRAGAARSVHRNRAYNKSIQEDPVQIDVNSVTDRVDWRHNGRCVRPLRRSDSTDAYGPTGWSRVKHDRTKHARRCKETTISTYAKFKGGQYFPPCTGFKVTTIYARNFMQGLPSGKGGYYVYHVTGGPPCHKLLHWDSKRGNNRIY